MSIKIRDDYYQDIIEIRYCEACQKQFAVGEELSRTVPVIICPYCGSKDTCASAWDDEDRGCAGIHFHKTDGRYYDRCCLCEQELTKEDIADVHLCNTMRLKIEVKEPWLPLDCGGWNICSLPVGAALLLSVVILYYIWHLSAHSFIIGIVDYIPD